MSSPALLSLRLLARPLPLETIDLSESGPNWAQLVLGFAVVTAVIAFALVRWYQGRQAGTVGAQRRHRRVVKGQLKNATGRMVLVTRSMASSTRRRHIRAALPGLRTSIPGEASRDTGRNATGGATTVADGGTGGGDAPSDDAALDDDDEDITTPPTVRAAFLRSVRAPVSSLPDVPPLLLRLTTEGLATLVLGSLLFVGLATWREQLHGSAVGGVPPLSTVTTALGTLVDWMGVLIGFFPFGRFTWLLVLPIVMHLGKALYQHWLAVSILLLVGAATIALLEYRLGEATERVHDYDLVSLRGTARAGARIGLVMAIVGITTGLIGHGVSAALNALAGVPGLPGLLATVLTQVPFGAVTDVVALLVTVAVGAFLAQRSLRRSWTRTKTMLATAARNDAATPVDRLGHLLAVRSVYSLVSILVAPIIVIYAAELVASGRLVAILAIVWSAPLTTKLGLGFVAGVLLFLVGLRSREAIGEAVSLWPLALGQKTITSFLFLSIGPFVAGIAVAVVLFVLGAGWASILVGLFAMTVLRLASLTVQRGSQKVFDIRRRRRDVGHQPGRAYLAGYELHDADGRPIHVCRLNSRTILAHRDPRRLCETVLDVLEHYFAHNEIPQTVAEHYWENAEAGLVDWSHTEAMTRQEARRSIIGHLREHGGLLRRETLLEKLDEERAFNHVDRMFDVVDPMFVGYDPGNVVEEQIRYLQTRAGAVEGRQGGEVLVLTE